MGVPGAIDVKHQIDVGAKRFAGGDHQCRDVLVQFNGSKALAQHAFANLAQQLGVADAQQTRIGGHLRAAAGAEQLRNRHAGTFASHVP